MCEKALQNEKRESSRIRPRRAAEGSKADRSNEPGGKTTGAENVGKICKTFERACLIYRGKRVGPLKCFLEERGARLISGTAG